MSTRIWGWYADIQLIPYLNTMAPYQFQTEDFALSPQGVHLLRNQYNFRTIAYENIREARIERSTEIRNAPVIFSIGIAMIAFAFYQTRWVMERFTDSRPGPISDLSILLPVIPFLLGAWCLYAAIRKGPILRLEEGNRIHKLRLRSAVKRKLTTELEDCLRKYLGPAFRVDQASLR